MSYLEDARQTLAAIRHEDIRPRSKTPANEPVTPSQAASKTCKSTSAGFAGREGAHLAEQIAAMPIDEFATAGLIVTVRSEALDCRVLFVSDNVPDEAIETNGLPVYRVAELRKLAQLRPSPGTIRCLNEIKAVFGGTIEVGEHDD